MEFDVATVLPEARLLRIFTCVIRHQGFAAAQQELHLSTSAISTYMSQLESLVGVVLCHRGRGGFSLTPKGEEFHQEALRLLGEVDGFERYAAGLRGELRGSIKLGVLDSTVSHKSLPLSEIIGAFTREHPALHLHLHVQSPYELQLSVLGNRLDQFAAYLRIGRIRVGWVRETSIPISDEMYTVALAEM